MGRQHPTPPRTSPSKDGELDFFDATYTQNGRAAFKRPTSRGPGTSAGGAEEAGRFLRIPGTDPFFPLDHGLQGNRILSILRANPMEVYLLYEKQGRLDEYHAIIARLRAERREDATSPSPCPERLPEDLPRDFV